MHRRYSTAEACSRLPTIVGQAESGFEIELTRRDEPVAVVISRREFERLRGRRQHAAMRYAAYNGYLRVEACRKEWDNPTMIVTLDEKRRLTVPVALAPAAPGDAFDARFDVDDDTIIFRRIKRSK